MSFISKTVRDRAISGKFLDLEGIWYNSTSTSEKFRLFRFLAAILNFGGIGKYCLSQKL